MKTKSSAVFHWHLLACALSTFALTACLSTPPYHGVVSDHFDGQHFYSPGATDGGGLGLRTLRWLFLRNPEPWPSHVDNRPHKAPMAHVTGDELRVTVVGHSTVLIQLAGLNILTDPVWSEKVGPFNAVGPQRIRPPALSQDELPRIDAVLISHNHYDHLDLPTLEWLDRRDHARVFAGLGNQAYFTAHGLTTATDLDWWQTVHLAKGVTLTSVPVRHQSMRGLFDHNTALWSGYVISFSGGRVYFAGDSGYGPQFAEAYKRLGAMRLSLLPVGAYLPRQLLSPIHMAPDEAVRAHRDLHAQRTVAIHLQTFQQTDEGYNEPLIDLERALFEQGVPQHEFLPPDFGIGREF